MATRPGGIAYFCYIKDFKFCHCEAASAAEAISFIFGWLLYNSKNYGSTPMASWPITKEHGKGKFYLSGKLTVAPGGPQKFRLR